MKILQLLLVFLLAAGMLSAQESATETAAGVYNDGLTALKAKEYSKALDLMVKAMEIADPEADAQVLKLAKQNGSIAAYYAGNDEIKEKNYEAAMMKFDKGIELNDKSYTNFYGKAKALDDEGKTAEAVEAYIKAADVATATGKGERAEKYLSRAENMIAVSYGDKKYDEAIAAGEAYLATHESMDVSYYLAKSMVEKGQASDAIAHAMKAHELGGDADDGKYVLGLAEVYEAAGNKSAAAETYGKVPKGKYYDHAQYKAGQIK
jgi:Flp pilus assembly protein TadD